MDRRDFPLRPCVRASTAVVAFVVALSTCPSAAAPATVGGPFTLMASDGTTVTDQTYRGKWLLVVFGYTSCPEVCPTTLYEIAAALELLGPDAARCSRSSSPSIPSATRRTSWRSTPKHSIGASSG